MGLTKEVKQGIVQQHGASQTDTGSTKVQVALLTKRINDLTEHLRAHPKDHYSRRGLLKLVGRRRRFLTYLQKHDLEGYRALIKELGLRRETRGNQRGWRFERAPLTTLTRVPTLPQSRVEDN